MDLNIVRIVLDQLDASKINVNNTTERLKADFDCFYNKLTVLTCVLFLGMKINQWAAKRNATVILLWMNFWHAWRTSVLYMQDCTIFVVDGNEKRKANQDFMSV